MHPIKFARKWRKEEVKKRRSGVNYDITTWGGELFMQNCDCLLWVLERLFRYRMLSILHKMSCNQRSRFVRLTKMTPWSHGAIVTKLRCWQLCIWWIRSDLVWMWHSAGLGQVWIRILLNLDLVQSGSDYLKLASKRGWN